MKRWLKKTFLCLLSLLFSCNGRTVFSPTVALHVRVRGGVPPLSLVLKECARLAAERSNGTFTLTVNEMSHRTDDRFLLTQAAEDGTGLVCIGTRALIPYRAEFAAFSAPFLFRDAAHFQKTASGPIGSGLFAMLSEKGWLGIGFIDIGTLQLFSRDQRLTSPAEFKKKRIRIPDEASLRRLIERCGGFAAPIPEAQTAAALKLGLIDAVVDFPWAFEARGFAPVVGRAAVIDLSRTPFVLLLSRSAASHLPAEAVPFLRRALQDALRNLPDEGEAIGALARRGIAIDRVTDMRAFAAAADAVYREQSEPVRTIIEKIKNVH